MSVEIAIRTAAHRLVGSLPLLMLVGATQALLLVVLVVLMIRRLRVNEQVRCLIDTAMSIARGDRNARCGITAGPLEELGRAFDDTATVLANEIRGLRATQRELEQLVVTDRLTGIGNRRQFEQQAELEAARAKRYGLPASLVLFDVDHFKHINDRYGHQLGDAVLVQLTRRVANRLRDTDSIARWGGEEFAILTSCTPLGGAEILAEKVRQIVAEEPFEVVGQVTISLGVAQMRLGESASHWIARADELLYEAKRNGRNRICSMPNATDPSMPFVLAWGDQFLVNHAQVDLEHAELFRLANELILVPEQCTRSAVLEKFDRLLETVSAHFQSEEAILAELGCSETDLEHHRQLHQGLVAQAIELRHRLEDGRVDLVDVSDFVMRRIAVGHLLNADLPLFSSLVTSTTIAVHDAPRPSLRVRIQRAMRKQGA